MWLRQRLGGRKTSWFVGAPLGIGEAKTFLCGKDNNQGYSKANGGIPCRKDVQEDHSGSEARHGKRKRRVRSVRGVDTRLLRANADRPVEPNLCKHCALSAVVFECLVVGAFVLVGELAGFHL